MKQFHLSEFHAQKNSLVGTDGYFPNRQSENEGLEGRGMAPFPELVRSWGAQLKIGAWSRCRTDILVCIQFSVSAKKIFE